MVIPMKIKRTDMQTGEEKTHLFYDGEELIGEILEEVKENTENINNKNYINEELLKEMLMRYIKNE